MITAHIASLPAREDGLERAVNSLLPQVDRMVVALNGYGHVPDFLSDPKIYHIILDNTLGDAAKFWRCSNVSGYVLACDDDLVYPEGYADYMIAGVKKHGGIVSLLGKQYATRPITSFRKGYTKIFRCLSRVMEDTEVDVVGTGVLVFHTDDFYVEMEHFPVPNMADIWVAKAAHQQGVKLTVLAHHARWVKHHNYPWRIWSHDSDDEFQTEVMNSFLK